MNRFTLSIILLIVALVFAGSCFIYSSLDVGAEKREQINARIASEKEQIELERALLLTGKAEEATTDHGNNVYSIATRDVQIAGQAFANLKGKNKGRQMKLFQQKDEAAGGSAVFEGAIPTTVGWIVIFEPKPTESAQE